MNNKSFQVRIANDLYIIAPLFTKYYIDKEYLLFSNKFKNRKYYIVSTNKENFMHLTGIKYDSAKDFYDKCIKQKLNDSDIVLKTNRDKGNIRRKIRSLYKLIGFFERKIIIQEEFIHNAVNCSIASTDLNITFGFCRPNKNNYVKPKTLLEGYKHISKDAYAVDLILSRNKGDTLLNEVIQGDKELIKKYDLLDLVIEELK